MSTSSYFHNLRSVYQAELDDLRTDSEGNNVMAKRLAEKRRELGFLLQMMALSPEMLAVVLHQAFRFGSAGAMDRVIAQDEGNLPEWDSISGTIEIATWARDIVQKILNEPMGEWFMTVAAALEYMYHKPSTAGGHAHADDGDDEDGEHDRDDVRNERHDDNHTEDHDEDEAAARAREEAGNDWMEQQGFDRKE